ncbi:MAG: hypothetical protein ABSC72_02495 [Methylovirgula sp.]|jgi:hypothetical protein
MQKSALRLCLLLIFLVPIPVSMNGVARADSPCAIDVGKPETLKLSGMLSHKIFPGPPNYENTRKGDRPEPAYILTLDKPVCASGISVGKDKPLVSTEPFSTIHLLFDGNKDIARELKRLVGKRVTVQGENGDEAFTGHHHAPFIMDVKAIWAEGKGR